MTSKQRREAYRDGLLLYTEGEVIDHKDAIIEVLFTEKSGGKTIYFAEIKGNPLCAHGDSIEHAIEEALFKDVTKSVTPAEKKKYRGASYKFSVALFRRLTGACRTGIDNWLRQKGLDSSVKMTLAQFRKAGGQEWADKLEEAISD